MSGPIKGANDNTSDPNNTETTQINGVRIRADLGKESLRPPNPKRFYSAATVLPLEGGFAVLLDGKHLKTPKKSTVVVPTVALAEAMAAEWTAQGERIDPASMPLTRLANTTIDAVVTYRDAVADDIVAFACNDALCYRADGPAALVTREATTWDAILTWARDALGADLIATTGIAHVAQSAQSHAALAKAVSHFSAWELAALHVMTTLTGSAILALAVAHARLTSEAAWSAAHVDEDWQITQWGTDSEAEARRAQRWTEMASAARFLELARTRI